ncbi:MAG: Hsp33 family molecular chaperone HslO [Acidaminococcaceae bacterium]
MNNYLTKGTVDGVRIYVLETTGLVQEANERHHCSHLGIAALGRAMNGALLLAATMKNDERVTLRFAGNGPLGTVVADATAGQVRGYVEHPDVFLPLKKGKLDVGGGIGQGNLMVTRVLNNAEPFSGFSELVDGEIASDLTNYLYTSEQTPSSVALGVLVNKNGQVLAAGGWFIQAMPDCSEEVLATLENNVLTMPYITELLQAGLTPEAIIRRIAQGLEVSIKETLPVEFKCTCTRANIAEMLSGLTAQDLEDLAEDEATEVHCPFCNTFYTFSQAEIIALKK